MGSDRSGVGIFSMRGEGEGGSSSGASQTWARHSLTVGRFLEIDKQGKRKVVNETSQSSGRHRVQMQVIILLRSWLMHYIMVEFIYCTVG